MFKIFNLFGSPFARLQKLVVQINRLEPELNRLAPNQLVEETNKLKNEPDLVRAFALVREAARRTLGQRPYDVQLLGGLVLNEGRIAEMMTGEGKTLAATAPAYFNALGGRGTHIVTVNEYLAKRDTVWMGQIYHLLGLKVACLIHEGALIYDYQFEPELDKERDVTGAFLVQEKFLRPASRREAYGADILYGTNHEFGFDYLRDNLVHSLKDQVQRGHHYAIIDEVDSILIDEARTPLIISAPDSGSSQFYRAMSRIVSRLEKEADYLVDEKMRSADITQAGIDKVEKALGIDNLFAPENLRLSHYLQECLRAYALYELDRDYVVKDGEVIIVDQFTGRLMWGRRYSGGLHQAIEAKEGVAVQQESRTVAQISIQNYFRLYEKLAGMTGTAQTSAEEFDKVYKLEAMTVPTHQPMIRQDLQDVIYKNQEAKFKAAVLEVKNRHQKGQPVLVGTASIERNEELSRRLRLAGVRHEILNAKNHEREGAIIAQAGRWSAVTVATNMAGRGVDIILGGNPQDISEAQKVREIGGLHVIGTERHEARRIDNQLRGRSGRQGDPGSSQFFLSLEDDLLRIFGGERIQNLMKRLDIPDEEPIQAGLISRGVAQAQAKIEGLNFDARKHLLEYDDVLNKQRIVFYKKRRELLENNSHSQILAALDFFWMTHLEDMESLAESVRLRAYGQHDPLVEYRREGHQLFQTLLANFESWVAENKERLQKMETESAINPQSLTINPSQKVGRNEPCPCGSNKKYKKCHGK